MTNALGAPVGAPAFNSIGETAYFFPFLLEPGEYTISVSGASGNECYSYTGTVEIVESRQPNFGPMPVVYAGCPTPIPVEPEGGVLSYIYNGQETVLDGYVFNAPTPDHYVLKYNYGCDNIVQLIVEAIGVRILGLNSAYYSSVTAVPMTGFPAGGTFSGPGVTGNVFSPSAAGVGTHTIVYTFVTPNGCVLTAQRIVQVISIACNAPSGLSVSNITQTGATVSWNGLAPTPTLYQVRYKKVGASVENFVNLPGTANSLTLTGLESSTNYQVRVRALCVSGVFSPFSPIVLFTTANQPGTCVAPTQPSASATFDGRATISWQAPNAPPTQIFEVEVTFPNGNGVIVTATGTSVQLDNLAPGNYTAVIYAVCDPANFVTVNFTVPVPPACLPVTQLNVV
ncbi:MAG: fibronectin type III domain-containing protein, partial [Bacteroidia bacterium]|nr:fibronectin type III domain-containing protein [Bacteroidia bacterium]MDW8335181.1 fibronectin type III domain-containing protein [Bacteroidia bacterium]